MPGKIDALLNEKLKNVEWGEYELQELFDITGTKSLDSNAIEFTSAGINFVGRTFENNGIQGKIQKRDFEPNEPYTITATVIGNYKYVKYQTEEYYCSQNINKLTPKNIIEKWNEKIAQFVMTNIQKFVSLYDGQQGGYKLEDIKRHKIKLPVKCGKIDFEFMENFVAELESRRVAELESRRVAELESYLLVTGLKDYILTAEEEKALSDLNNLEWKEFDITEIFTVKNTANILSSDIVENSGTTPYLCASAENNGVNSYITYNQQYLEEGNCIFIGGKTFVVSYQEKDFYSNDSHNLALYLEKSIREKHIQFYIATCLYKSLRYKYSWGDSVSKTKIKKDKILLPVKDSCVDYSVMKNYISAIQKLVIKDVVLFADSKIEATKSIIENK